MCVNKKCEEKRMPYIIIILVLAALDQITKQLMFNVSGGVQGFSIPIIDKFFHLTYVENHGGVFGLLQGKINLFTIASAILIIYVIAVEYKNFKNYSKWTKIGVAVIAAGAMGNMIDRILRGYVIDMIDFRGIWAFVFNVADMYVHIGIYIIIIDYLVRKCREKKSGE
ncbi:signal peptidase II [Leptotrichia wadei]|nr:signal peptidase II [Leptotrichia wadei]